MNFTCFSSRHNRSIGSLLFLVLSKLLNIFLTWLHCWSLFWLRFARSDHLTNSTNLGGWKNLFNSLGTNLKFKLPPCWLGHDLPLDQSQHLPWLQVSSVIPLKVGIDYWQSKYKMNFINNIDKHVSLSNHIKCEVSSCFACYQVYVVVTVSQIMGNCCYSCSVHLVSSLLS